MEKKIKKFLIISEAIVLLLSGIITVSAVAPGCIEVTKIVDWNGVDPIIGQTFEICITGPSYSDGNCKIFTYPDELVLEWCDLLPGEYTVAEIYPGDEWTVEVTGSPAVVPYDGYAYASVTNTRKLGCLEVTKIIDWNGVDPIIGQTFEICITGPSYPGGDCKTFTYPDVLTQEWCDLIPGAYVVTEPGVGSEWTVVIDDSGATVPDDGGYGHATVTNTRKLGCLEVTKIVNWNGVDPIIGQTFEICITGPSYPGGDCKTFTYPDDLTQIWCDLIPGDYTISETDPGDMWVVHGDGVTVSIPTDGSSASAEITNTYTVPEGCTHTQGYWKTHSEYGPAPYDNTWAELPDGADTEFFGTGHTYYEILNMDSRGGNAYIILAHQYIAAELNGLNNDDSLPSHITDIMGDAELLLIDYQSSLEIPKKNPDRSYAITLAGELDGFNNGYYPGWPHCDDNDDD